MGHAALQSMTSADSNTAFGSSALAAATTGHINCAFGSAAGDAITTGQSNTVVGMAAGSAITTGSFNVAIGEGALVALTTGSNNIAIGHDAARASSPTGNLTGELNKICMGNNSHDNFSCKVSLTVTSDKRDKTDITDFTHGLSWITKLRPVTYRWDMRSFYEDGIPDGSKKGKRLNIGLLAQEELEVEKEHGFANDKNDMLITTQNAEGNYGMEYERIVPILINAIKELSAEVNALKAA